MPRLSSSVIGSCVALLLIYTSIRVIDAQTGPLPDEHCVPMLDPRECGDVALAFCQEVMNVTGFCAGPDCTRCESPTGMPNSVCVYWEGKECEDYGQYVDCYPADRYDGECWKVQYVCVCYNQHHEEGELCDGVYWVCQYRGT